MYQGMTMRPYVILLLMLIIITGCGLISKEPPSSVQAIQNTVKEAQDNLDAVERLQLQELYPYDFQEAQNELISAEHYFHEKSYNQAYLSALRSLAASQRIFRQLYQDIIIPSAQEAKTEIWTSADEEPNSPLHTNEPDTLGLRIIPPGGENYTKTEGPIANGQNTEGIVKVTII